MLSRRSLLLAAPALLVGPVSAQFSGCLRGPCNPAAAAITPSGGDPYWSSVKLLMSFDSSFTDESPAAHGAATATGSPAIRTSFSVFGGSSGYFNGSSRVSFPDSNDWNLSNRRFTIEFWYRASSTGLQALLGQWQASGGDVGWIISTKDNLGLDVGTDGVSATLNINSGSIISANTWYAACIDFDGAKYRLYVDGVMRGSSTSLKNIWNSSLPLTFGAGAVGGEPYTGYIDEFRLTMDVARYASDSGYAVTTQPFPRR